MDIQKEKKSAIRGGWEVENREKTNKQNLNKTETAAMLHGDGDRQWWFEHQPVDLLTLPVLICLC